jgi:O-antigen/teichoic acid export membrane protein
MSDKPATAVGALRNAVYGASTWMLPIGLSFVATPVIVNSLGHKGYGVYAMILGIIGYSFNLNTGRAVTKYVAGFRSGGDRMLIARAVAATLAVNLAVGTAGGLALGLASEWLARAVLRVDDRFAPDAVAGLWLAGAIIFATMQWQALLAVIQGFQRFDLFSRFTNAASVLTVGGAAALAFGGAGIRGLLAWNISVIAAMWAVTFFAARKLLPGGWLSVRPDAAMARRIVAFSGSVVLYQVISNATLLFERGVILRRLGDESLTYYVVPMSLGFYLHGFVSSLLLFVFPLSSEIGADRERLKLLYHKANKAVLLFVAFGTVTLVAESELFLRLWMGPELAAAAAPTLVVQAVTFAIAALLVVTWNMADGLGHPGYNLGIYAVCFAVSAAGIYFFAGPSGILGAAFSRLAGFVILLPSIPYVEKWFFDKIQYGFWLRTLASVVPAAVAAWIVQRSVVGALPDGWPSFAAAIAASGLAYSLVLLGTGFVTVEERALVRRFFGRH